MPIRRIQIDPLGYLIIGDMRLRCALGKGGISTHKREGDGATPAGNWHMLKVFYRPDRIQTAPDTKLEVTEIQEDMGWCDDPSHIDYNQLIHLPHPARHENLWRDDHIYDVVVQLDHNTAPIQPGAGSAIFMHIAKPDYSPTEGCIALNQKELLDLLRNCNSETVIHIPDVST